MNLHTLGAASTAIAPPKVINKPMNNHINTLEYKKVVFSRTKEDKYTEKDLGLKLES